jgi:SAM-dependent methyltransferase
LALAFARTGAQVCGVDPDADMIACAKKKSEGSAIDWHVATLPQVEGDGDFDAITASLDVVNHITLENELMDTFCAARRLLRRGGVLVFDINTEKKFREVYGDNCYIFRELGAFAAWENDYDEKRELCRFTVDVFTQNGEKYERRTDIIYERMYRDERIRLLLREAGFRTVLWQGMDQGTRHIYIAK